MEGSRLLRLFTKPGGTWWMLGRRDEESHESGWGTTGCLRSEKCGPLYSWLYSQPSVSVNVKPADTEGRLSSLYYAILYMPLLSTEAPRASLLQILRDDCI